MPPAPFVMLNPPGIVVELCKTTELCGISFSASSGLIKMFPLFCGSAEFCKIVEASEEEVGLDEQMVVSCVCRRSPYSCLSSLNVHRGSGNL